MNKKNVLFWIALVAVSFILAPMLWGMWHKYFSEDATPVQQTSYAELRDAPVGSILLGTRRDGKEIPLAVVVSLLDANGGVILATFNSNVPGALLKSKKIIQTQGVLKYEVMGDMPTRLVNVFDSDYPSVKCDFIMMTSHLSKKQACPELEEKQEKQLQQTAPPSVPSEALG